MRREEGVSEEGEREGVRGEGVGEKDREWRNARGLLR